MTVVAIIPARYASSRFPGKPLALIGGQPMIRLVYQLALKIPGLEAVYVATDSQEIAQTVRAFGGQVLMTKSEHQTGTDRLGEAADLLALTDSDLVLNVQGDQPALNPNHPALLVQALLSDPNLPMATLAVPLLDPAEANDPNHVKVVFNHQNLALYFSLAPIPWPRDGGPGSFYKHVGLYGYRVGFLRQYLKWPQGRLEVIENLEQLRALERGVPIKVLLAEGLSPEVDLPQDIAKVEAALSGHGQK
ncbi:MAG: 3-deoxy-manno-octulosonate cytidylyltransferase [Deltaproteobacteria bacterium]|jgi:3-deoxy-manno-octulosonate cytidylyltransferase (CMP-KDO synthetase)|nr:3-deoxy-manno-octulosonate cytidylyltransferase [Deltaproteobacteria bacterium]